MRFFSIDRFEKGSECMFIVIRGRAVVVADVNVDDDANVVVVVVVYMTSWLFIYSALFHFIYSQFKRSATALIHIILRSSFPHRVAPSQLSAINPHWARKSPIVRAFKSAMKMENQMGTRLNAGQTNSLVLSKFHHYPEEVSSVIVVISCYRRPLLAGHSPRAQFYNFYCCPSQWHR